MISFRFLDKLNSISGDNFFKQKMSYYFLLILITVGFIIFSPITYGISFFPTNWLFSFVE